MRKPKLREADFDPRSSDSQPMALSSASLLWKNEHSYPTHQG